jgi:hypothetical protein
MGQLGLIYIGQSQQFYYLILVSLTPQMKGTVKQAISMRLMKRIQLRSPRVAPPGGARGKKIAPPLPSPLSPPLPLPPLASSAAVVAPRLLPKVVEGSDFSRWKAGSWGRCRSGVGTQSRRTWVEVVMGGGSPASAACWRGRRFCSGHGCDAASVGRFCPDLLRWSRWLDAAVRRGAGARAVALASGGPPPCCCCGGGRRSSTRGLGGGGSGASARFGCCLLRLGLGGQL